MRKQFKASGSTAMADALKQALRNDNTNRVTQLHDEIIIEGSPEFIESEHRKFIDKFKSVADNYREAYGNRISSYPRRCTFIGTTNGPK